MRTTCRIPNTRRGKSSSAMADPRRKGAAFERSVARELFRETGISFRRDLDQYRERDRGDLLSEDESWPFLIECKDWAAAKTFRAAWAEQAHAAARITGKLPCVIYKANRGEIRCRVWFDSIAAAFGGSSVTHHHFETGIDGLAFLAREIMASRALKGDAQS